MDEEIMNNIPEETTQDQNDPLKEAIEAEMKKVQMSALLSGSKAICHVILGYIAEFRMAPGKKSFRQQEKLIKRIQDFCKTGVSRTIDENGEIVPVEKSKEASE